MGFIVSNMPTGVIHSNTVDGVVCMSKYVVGGSGVGSAVHLGQVVRIHVHYLMPVSPNSSPCHPCRAFPLRASSHSDAFFSSLTIKSIYSAIHIKMALLMWSIRWPFSSLASVLCQVYRFLFLFLYLGMRSIFPLFSWHNNVSTCVTLSGYEHWLATVKCISPYSQIYYLIFKTQRSGKFGSLCIGSICILPLILYVILIVQQIYF